MVIIHFPRYLLLYNGCVTLSWEAYPSCHLDVSTRYLWSSRRCSISVYFTLGYNVYFDRPMIILIVVLDVPVPFLSVMQPIICFLIL